MKNIIRIEEYEKEEGERSFYTYKVYYCKDSLYATYEGYDCNRLLAIVDEDIDTLTEESEEKGEEVQVIWE